MTMQTIINLNKLKELDDSIQKLEMCQHTLSSILESIKMQFQEIQTDTKQKREETLD